MYSNSKKEISKLFKPSIVSSLLSEGLNLPKKQPEINPWVAIGDRVKVVDHINKDLIGAIGLVRIIHGDSAGQNQIKVERIEKKDYYGFILNLENDIDSFIKLTQYPKD